MSPRSRHPFLFPCSRSVVVGIGLVIAMGLASACAGPGDPVASSDAPDPGGVASTPEAASAALADLVDDLWQEHLEDPMLRLREGLLVERLWDLSHEHARALDGRSAEYQQRLRAIDAELLVGEERITWDVIDWTLRMQRQGHAFFWHVPVLTPYSGSFAYPLSTLFSSLPLEDAEDLASYLRLVAEVPALIDQIEARARGRLERGIAVAKPALPAIVGLLESYDRPAMEGPYALGQERVAGLRGVAEADLDEARERLVALVETEINPRWRRLQEWVETDLHAAAPEEVGLSRSPGGEEAYRFFVRRAATYDVEPEEIRSIGEAMVAEIGERMAEIRTEVGFAGDARAFRDHLRSDPSFFPKTPEEVARRLVEAAKEMEQEADALFDRRPKAPWGVERLPPELEPGMTYGYYDSPKPGEPRGLYYFNGTGLDRRSWIGFESLAYHELVPGHHFQAGLARENEALPKLRRFFYPTAYLEGWGTYASGLGLDVGLYRDPYSRYGFYALESFLASRLVLDPGMNLFGMSLEEGRAFMDAHTFEGEAQIASETLRYSTDIPGQAVAYQLGNRRLRELRERAREALGERFDIRAFHQVVLGSGALPLEVLGKKVDRWIESELAGSD